MKKYCHACRALDHSECAGGDRCWCFCPRCPVCMDIVDGAPPIVNGPPQAEAFHDACRPAPVPDDKKETDRG